MFQILNKISNQKSKIQNIKGFSLVELLVVIVIIGILSTVSYVAIQRAKSKALNERMLDDLIMIANSLEDFRQDSSDNKFPVPLTKEEDPLSELTQNVICYYEDATYAHDCNGAAFRQGMIDNDLLSKKYLRQVPTDPRTGSRYVYGVTNDGRFFQVAGNFEGENDFEARLAGNLEKGFYLPSIIRAYDGPNFVVTKGTYLPYSADHMVLTATLENKNGEVLVSDVEPKDVENGLVVHEGKWIETKASGSVDIYFSDGSFTHMDPGSKLQLKSMQVAINDKKETSTKILLNLDIGKIWSKVVRLAKKSEFRVETTNSIAGVRGTEFSIDDDGNVKVKAGEVWQLQAGDELHLQSGVFSLDVQNADEILELIQEQEEQITADEEPEIIQAANVVTAEPETYIAQDDDYYNEYNSIPLHNGIQPYIISIQGGEIIVRDVNHYVNAVDSTRQIRATHLTAYRASDREFIKSKPFPQLVETLPAPVKKAKLDAILDTEGRYILPDVSIGEPLILRFEYIETGHVVRASSFTATPQITTETRVSQYDLYPEQFDDRPTISVTAPNSYAYDEAMPDANQFPVRINLDGVSEGEEIIYSVISDSGILDNPCTGVPETATKNTLSHTFEVNTSGEGDCALIAAVLLPDGNILSKDVVVRVAAGGALPTTGGCGDGDVDPGETCDDGNNTTETICDNYDGECSYCNADCTNEFTINGPFCGDGTLQTVYEQCDDGGNAINDGCDANCRSEAMGTCGDGTQNAGEQCDDGTNNDMGEGYCLADCSGIQSCGDGAINGTEECEEGDLGGATCDSLGYPGDSLGCYAADTANPCRFDTSGCVAGPSPITITGPATVNLGLPANLTAVGPDCTWTILSGGGFISNDGRYDSASIDGNEADRFDTSAYETVIIKCIDTSDSANFAIHDLVVNYVPKAHSAISGYDYSYFTMGGVSHAAAIDECNNLTEGGASWHLPRNSNLSQKTTEQLLDEGAYWCGEWTGSECEDMPPGTASMWLEETFGAEAYMIWGNNMGNIITYPQDDGSLTGFRCVK